MIIKRNWKKYISLAAFLILTIQINSSKAQQINQRMPVSLSLSEAIQIALENNYGISISKYDAEIAGISNAWGQAGRYPSIDMDLSSANNFNISSDDNYGTNRISGGVGMHWVLFNGFKVQITKDKLESLEDLAKGRSAVIVENTIQDVIEAYYSTLLQVELRRVFQKVMELSDERYKAEQLKKDYGGSVTYQVLQAKNLFLGDQYQLLNQEIMVKTAMRNLSFLLAEDPNVSWELTDPFEHAIQNFIADDLLAKMKSSNHTIQNQYINLQIKKEDRKLADASYFPSVSFSSGLDNSFTNQYIPGTGNTTAAGMTPYANLSLTYNLYTGGSRNRTRQISEINETIAQTETKEMVHLVSNHLLNELDAYVIRKAQLDVATESVKAAELNLGIAEDKLRSGAINSFNYRDIQLLYLNAALQKVQAIYALIQSHTNLTRLTGGFVEDRKGLLTK
ncbi:MAG: TolC family protein [Bacteroidota bacterium]|nr:TolC family protein [Bacteroidota bacterium]